MGILRTRGLDIKAGAAKLKADRAARRFTGGPVPRKDEPTAPTSGKHRSVGRVPFATLSSPTEHGPGQIPVPHTRRPGPFSPKASGATMGAMPGILLAGNTAVPSRLHMCRAGRPVGARQSRSARPFPNNSGSRAMLMAMQRASSFVSVFASSASASFSRPQR
jgi:hypothetical protein